MKVLVACEFSGVVRSAFEARGHSATSCDILPADDCGRHYQGDVLQILDKGWGLMIAFPPCTYLASSGARWWKEQQKEQMKALEFVACLMNADIPRIAIENPIGKISTSIRKPNQIIQPWMFGHGETKATCLWLKRLPKLKPTNVVSGREAKIHKLSALRGPGSSKDRRKNRSITYRGIAEAMAEQWGVGE